MSDLAIYDIFDIGTIRRFITGHGEVLSLRRGDLFVRMGDKAGWIGLVRSGMFGYRHSDHKGEDRTMTFAFAGDLVGAYIALPGRRSMFDVVALCPSSVIRIPYTELVEFMDRECPPGYRTKLTEAIAFGFMKRAMEYRCVSPESRFRELLAREPDVVDMIPMSYIASWLGISREAFARLRRRIFPKA